MHMTKKSHIHFSSYIVKRAEIDAERVGLLNLIPLVGGSMAHSSLNMQDPSRATAWRSFRDMLRGLGMTLGGAGVGAAAGAGVGAAAGAGVGAGAAAGAAPGALVGGIAGLLGGQYFGGKALARWRQEEKPEKDPEARVHSSLLAMLNPYVASSLLRKSPGDVVLRGTGGLLAGSLVPFVGSGLAHYALHAKPDIQS